MPTKKLVPTIKIIAFDLGDVLVRDDTKRLEDLYGFDNMSKQKQRQYIDAFHEAEVGRLPTAKLFKIIRETLMPDSTLKEIREEILTVPLNRPNWQLALRLKKHYQIVILSNSQHNWPQAIAHRLKINLKQFPLVNSAEIGIRKPHRDYFQYVLRKFRVKPEEMVFIDDRIANIKTAKKMGIHTFWYLQNHKSLLKFLRQLKIKGLGKVE